MKKYFKTTKPILNIVILCVFSIFFIGSVLDEDKKQESLMDQKAPEPHLVFKKSVVIKEYKGGQAFIEPHTIKKNEYLWKILREHYKLTNPKIAFYCKIARVVNPEIKDLNRLEPNQKIHIPYKYIKGLQSESGSVKAPVSDIEYVVKPGEHLAKILRDQYHIPESFLFNRETYRLIRGANPKIKNVHELEEGQKIIIPGEILAFQQYSLPDKKIAQATIKETAKPDVKLLPEETIVPEPKTPEKESRIKEMMSFFTSSFNGTDNSTGKDAIMLQGRSSVTLDYSKFPVYQFPWGKKILVDFGDKLPSGLKEVITSEWENAEVVTVRERDDMESILDKVLDVAGFHKVEKDGEYIVNRDNIQVSVNGNWIVFKDNMLKNVFVVNLIESDGTTINPELKTYLTSQGLEIVEVTSGKAAQEKTRPTSSKKIEYQKIQAEPIILTDMILNILGQKYYKDYNTEIFQNIYSGFSLEVMADRMFEKDGSIYLIDFHNLPEKICQIIDQQGFHLLQIDIHKEELTGIAKKVLNFCDASKSSFPAQFQYHSGKKSSIKLTIPGFLIETGSVDVLLTQVGLKEPIIDFLSEKNVKIIQF